MIAALYVETGGAYYGLGDVDPWDEKRDARLYPGPWPVVAHPPCRNWCRMAPQREAMGHYKIGDDGGTFAAALASVQEWGGVLEHPAYSLAFDAFYLPNPTGPTWQALVQGGWVASCEQAGHQSSKPTWLYYVGDKPPHSIPEAAAGSRRFNSLSKRQRNGTPVAFRDYLLSLAVLASQQRERARVDGAPGRTDTGSRVLTA